MNDRFEDLHNNKRGCANNRTHSGEWDIFTGHLEPCAGPHIFRTLFLLKNT